MSAGPTLNHPADRRCNQAARHLWERTPAGDIELGAGDVEVGP